MDLPSPVPGVGSEVYEDAMLRSDSPATKRRKFQTKVIPVSDDSLPTAPADSQLPADGKPDADLSLKVDADDNDGHKDHPLPSCSPSAEPSAEEAPTEVLRMYLIFFCGRHLHSEVRGWNYIQNQALPKTFQT